MVILFDKGSQNIPVCFIVAAGQHEPVPADHFAATDEEHLHAGLAAEPGQTEHILIAGAGDDILLFHHLPHRSQLITQPPGQLELQVLGGGQHPPLQVFFHISGATFQKQTDRSDHRQIRFLVDQSGAGRQATFDVIFQTGSLRIHAAAATQRKQLLQQRNRLMHRPGAGIGAIVFGTVLFQPARSINPGESLVQRHLDEGVGLVVTQADIVARSVFFDQVAFENQRFHLGCCDNRLKAGDPRH